MTSFDSDKWEYIFKLEKNKIVNKNSPNYGIIDNVLFSKDLLH